MQPEAHDVGGRPAVKPRPVGKRVTERPFDVSKLKERHRRASPEQCAPERAGVDRPTDSAAERPEMW